jgi:hypothetical protein
VGEECLQNDQAVFAIITNIDHTAFECYRAVFDPRRPNPL